MKTIQKVVKTENLREFYVAEDGTEFMDKEQCLKYEDSALFAVKSKLIGSKALTYLPTGYKEKKTGATYFGLEMLFNDSCDWEFYLFCPHTDEDIKLFIQLCNLVFDNMKKPEKRTKEFCSSLAENLLIDDSDKWEAYKHYTWIDELEIGKKYILHFYDGWGGVHETEAIKKATSLVVDTLVEQFSAEEKSKK